MEVVEFSCLPNCTGRWTQKCYELFIKICITEWQNKYAKYLVPINVCVYIIQHMNPFHNNNSINTIIIIILLSSWVLNVRTYNFPISFVRIVFYYLTLSIVQVKRRRHTRMMRAILAYEILWPSLLQPFRWRNNNRRRRCRRTLLFSTNTLVYRPPPPLNHPPTITPGRARCYSAHAHRETAVN